MLLLSSVLAVCAARHGVAETYGEAPSVSRLLFEASTKSMLILDYAPCAFFFSVSINSKFLASFFLDSVPPDVS